MKQAAPLFSFTTASPLPLLTPWSPAISQPSHLAYPIYPPPHSPRRCASHKSCIWLYNCRGRRTNLRTRRRRGVSIGRRGTASRRGEVGWVAARCIEDATPNLTPPLPLPPSHRAPSLSRLSRAGASEKSTAAVSVASCIWNAPRSCRECISGRTNKDP